MAVTRDDLLELAGLAAALAALLTVALVLASNGMFSPVRPERQPLTRFLVASRVVGRRSSAGECMARVERDLPRDVALGVGVGAPAADAARLEPARGDYFSVHFGPVRDGEARATAASAGVVLEVGEGACEAERVAWARRLEGVAGVVVEVVACDGVGLQVAFPWAGPLSRLIARFRVFRKLGKHVVKELRTRPQFSPCFVQVFSKETRKVLVHVPLTPSLVKMREQHGLNGNVYVR